MPPGVTSDVRFIVDVVAAAPQIQVVDSGSFIYSLSLDDEDRWRTVDLTSFVPPRNGMAVTSIQIFAVGAWVWPAPTGPVPVHVASLIAFYQRPNAPIWEPAPRSAFILQETGDGEWKAVHQNDEESGRMSFFAERFLYDPQGQRAYAFMRSMQSGTAEDEWGSLFVSLDGGSSWGFKELSSPGDMPFAELLQLPEEGQVWAATDNPCKDRGGVALSRDGGATWTSMFKKIPTRMVTALFYEEDLQRVIVVGRQKGSTFHPSGGPVLFQVNPKTLRVRTIDLAGEVQFLEPADQDSWEGVVILGGEVDLIRLAKKTGALVGRHGLQIGRYTLPVPGVPRQYVSKLDGGSAAFSVIQSP
jgi:hypothetical protein